MYCDVHPSETIIEKGQDLVPSIVYLLDWSLTRAFSPL